jgi:hypothetical protein
VRRTLLVLTMLAGVAAAPAARAQVGTEPVGPEVETLEGQSRFRTPQRFAFELRFGPYRPDVDGEFDGTRQPYQEYFGSGSKLLTQMEFDYEILHRIGTVAVGLGLGYFSVSAPSPVASGTGMLSADESTFKVVPLSLSAIYRFDYFLELKKFPLVPYGKLGLDWAYWQITDGNDEIATDGLGGKARGGTLGWHAAVGLAFVLDFVDPDSARAFDADMGVNHTSLVFQFTHADISGLGMSNRLHVGDTNWSLGIMFQF